jgi:cysteine synthase
LDPGFSKKTARHWASSTRQSVPGRFDLDKLLLSSPVATWERVGLAIVCAVKGHPFVAVMSRGNSAERAQMMRALGAEVGLVDQAPGSPAGQVSGADLELVEARALWTEVSQY